MNQKHATRLDALQVLRAVAALAVVLFHCHWTGVASFGVELFFTISGFVICHAAAQHPRHFLLKRIARVVPLYWLATLGVFALASVAPSLLPSTQVSGLNLLRSLAFWPYVRGDGADMPLLFLGWTLNYEAFFYVVFAASLAISARLAPYLALAALLAIASLHGLVAHWGDPLEFWTRPILLNFACGIVAWLVWHNARAGLLHVSRWFASTVAVVAMAILVTGANHGIGGPLPSGGIVSGALLLACLALGPRLRWPTALLLIGDASYSLYLLHPYVLEVVNRKIHAFGPDLRGVLATALAIGVALVLALVMFRVVERPSNRIARRWIG